MNFNSTSQDEYILEENCQKDVNNNQPSKNYWSKSMQNQQTYIASSYQKHF